MPAAAPVGISRPGDTGTSHIILIPAPGEAQKEQENTGFTVCVNGVKAYVQNPGNGKIELTVCSAPGNDLSPTNRKLTVKLRTP